MIAIAFPGPLSPGYGVDSPGLGSLCDSRIMRGTSHNMVLRPVDGTRTVQVYLKLTVLSKLGSEIVLPTLTCIFFLFCWFFGGRGQKEEGGGVGQIYLFAKFAPSFVFYMTVLNSAIPFPFDFLQTFSHNYV